MTVNIENNIIEGPMLPLKSMEMLMYLKERVMWKPLHFKIVLPVHRKYFLVLCRSPNDPILDVSLRQVVNFPSPDGKNRMQLYGGLISRISGESLVTCETKRILHFGRWDIVKFLVGLVYGNQLYR